MVFLFIFFLFSYFFLCLGRPLLAFGIAIVTLMASIAIFVHHATNALGIRY